MLLREAYYLFKVFRQRNLELRKLKKLQFFFLKNVVQHAYENNRFYRTLYQREGFHPRKLESFGDLEKIPIVTKQDLLENRDAFYDKNIIRGSKVLYTSGTTTSTFKVYIEEEASDYLNAIFVRTLHDQGYNPLRPLGFYWYRKERNSVFSRLGFCRKVLISSEMTPRRQLDLLRRARARFLYYFPFKLYEFANSFDKETLRSLRIKGIFCIGEILTQGMKSFFEERFGCPVTDNYGLTEFNIAAYQRPGRNTYEINDDSVLFETEEVPGIPSNLRRPVITAFFNRTTPFIRYRIDDLVEVGDDGTIEAVLGHSRHNLLFGNSQDSPGIREVVDTLLAFSDSVFLFRFSLSENEFIVRILPKKKYDVAVRREIQAAVRSIVPGDVRVVEEKRIPFLDRGKFRLVETERNK